MMSTSPQNRIHSRASDHAIVRRRRDGCTECRRKKVKCDLQRPVCLRCKRFPRHCSYDLNVISQAPLKPRFPQRIEHKKVSSPVENIAELPRQLNVALFPSIQQPTLNLSPLLSSDESKFLMHIFATQTAKTLFPAAPDLVLQRMISSSLVTPHLLHALLASACSHHGRLVKDSSPRPMVTCLKYTNLAISDLRKELSSAEPRLRVEMVTTAMALCTNDVCNGNMEIWRTHLRGVLRLLVAFLGDQTISSTATGPFTEFLVKWFKTMDIIAALSGRSGQCIHISENKTLNQVLPPPRANVDNICGYSLKLIPLMAEISSLARKKQFDTIDGFVSSNSSISEIELEADIQVLIEEPRHGFRQDGYGAFGIELQSTHRAFVHSALLHLHRRVNMLPRHDIRVRTDISNILEAVAQIPPFSFANILILWPIFSAGCETDIAAEREVIQERMKNMQTLGMGNFTRARELLHRFWSSGTSLPWDEYFSQLGLELVLF